MTKKELLDILKKLADKDVDPETAHIRADEALLSFIDDEEIAGYFAKIKKWYA